jgi:hypothetical protein
VLSTTAAGAAGFAAADTFAGLVAGGVAAAPLLGVAPATASVDRS